MKQSVNKWYIEPHEVCVDLVSVILTFEEHSVEQNKQEHL